MDKGLDEALRTTQKSNPSPRQEALANLLDSIESETECVPVYDSHEVASDYQSKRKPVRLQTKCVLTKKDEGEQARLLSDDTYSDECCDPNSRTNQTGSFKSPQISIKGYYTVPDKSSQPCGDRHGLVMKGGGYKYIIDTRSGVVVTPRIESDRPYHLHPQDSPDSAVAYPQCDKQEMRHTEGGLSQLQHLSTPALWNPTFLASKKPERLKENIVERNKRTLRHITYKCDSYVMTHTRKNKVDKNPAETTRTEHQKESSDPKKRWLQKTQPLEEISEGTKGQWEEYPNLPAKEQSPALGVRAELGDSMNSQLARPVTLTQPKPKNTTSSPLTPTSHLNINLNTLLPLFQARTQDSVINLAYLHGSHCCPTSQLELAFSSGYQQTNVANSKICHKELNLKLHPQNLEGSPETWQRTPTLKCPLACVWEEQKWVSNGFHSQQNPPTTPSTTSSLGSSSFTALPPIRKPMTRKECELNPGQSVNTAHLIHKSSSDGYLLQMEKQKQLRMRVIYKTNTLKDYKELKSDIGALGPDYKTIEKINTKQQRLYSNVIHEDLKKKKKTSSIPSLPAKDLEGNDQNVPRMKALEYAKTIVKPSIQPKQRQRYQSEGFTKHNTYLECLEMSQPATLDILRKRHEEEKKAVALFTKVHSV